MISGVIIVSINEFCVHEGFKAGPFLQFLWVPRSDRDLWNGSIDLTQILRLKFNCCPVILFLTTDSNTQPKKDTLLPTLSGHPSQIVAVYILQVPVCSTATLILALDLK
jgi:hypothetical protein